MFNAIRNARWRRFLLPILALGAAWLSAGAPAGALGSADSRPSNAGWVELGSGSATDGGISRNDVDSYRPTAVIAADGSLFVAWGDWSDGDAEIYVRRWRNNNWEEVGSGSASGGGVSNTEGDSRQPALAAAPDGSIYLAWAEYTSWDSEIYVRRWNGSAWVEVGSGSASGSGVSNNLFGSAQPTLAVHPTGVILLAWQDLGGFDWDVYVRAFVNGRWEEVGSGSATGEGVSRNSRDSTHPSIVVNSAGRPVVGWTDASDGDTDVYVRQFDGESWVALGTDSAGGDGISPGDGHSRLRHLAAAPDGSIYAAWAEEVEDDHDDDGVYQVYVRRWNGTSWAEMGRDSASGRGISNTKGQVQDVALTLGPGGKPYVAWSDGSDGDEEVYIRRWNGQSWEEIGEGSAGKGGVSDNGGPSMQPYPAVDSAGRVYMVWQDFSDGDPDIYVRASEGGGGGSTDCYPLQLTHSGSGSDPVATPAQSAGCPAGQYNAGAVVGLSASPAAGWGIIGWSGTVDDSSPSTTNSLTMPANSHLAAVIYAQVQPTCHKLTLVHAGSGSDPTASPANSGGCPGGFYTEGQALTLRAAPAAGWSVGSWQGTANDAAHTLSNTATMPAGDHVVTVNYEAGTPTCFRLSLEHRGRGGDPTPSPAQSESCPPGNYVLGEVVTLTAAPANGAYVGGWEGTDADASGAMVNRVTMPAALRTVVVVYEELAALDYHSYGPAAFGK
ncbi:hypothetical protein [Promineifilum sp.]|uniref:InlB B-repeat-containing protein n=1 Tax=Promineifilum sp. TaxID=2664178 RepID=UPI0035AEBB4B